MAQKQFLYSEIGNVIHLLVEQVSNAFYALSQVFKVGNMEKRIELEKRGRNPAMVKYS